jgi:hypothetical protein
VVLGMIRELSRILLGLTRMRPRLEVSSLLVLNTEKENEGDDEIQMKIEKEDRNEDQKEKGRERWEGE